MHPQSKNLQAMFTGETLKG